MIRKSKVGQTDTVVQTIFQPFDQSNIRSSDQTHKMFPSSEKKKFDLLIPSSEIRPHNNFTLEPCLINSNTIFEICNIFCSNKLLFFNSNNFSGWVHPGFWRGCGHRSYHHHCPGKYKYKNGKIRTKTKTKTKNLKEGNINTRK